MTGGANNIIDSYFILGAAGREGCRVEREGRGREGGREGEGGRERGREGGRPRRLFHFRLIFGFNLNYFVLFLELGFLVLF